MKEYLVSIDIIMKHTSSEKFGDLFDLASSSFECLNLSDSLLFRIKSNIEPNLTIREHINAIFANFGNTVIKSRMNSKTDVAYINIGVFCDTITCTVDISFDCLELLAAHGVGAQISYYLCEADEPKRTRPPSRSSAS